MAPSAATCRFGVPGAVSSASHLHLPDAFCGQAATMGRGAARPSRSGEIDETYGRWRDAHKLPARPLELEEFFRAFGICRRLRPKRAELAKNFWRAPRTAERLVVIQGLFSLLSAPAGNRTRT